MHCSNPKEKIRLIGPNFLVICEKMRELGYSPKDFDYVPIPLYLQGLRDIDVYNPFAIDFSAFASLTSGKNVTYILEWPKPKVVESSVPGKRESKDVYFLKIARLVATRSTCPRRSVGCVIVDKNYHIKATGYNGVPKGFPHCIETPCGGHSHSSGQGLNSCMATHAEQNALLQCNDTQTIHTIYVTTSPCITCAKLIANTSCKMVIYAEEYSDKSGIEMLRTLGIEAVCIGIKD